MLMNFADDRGVVEECIVSALSKRMISAFVRPDNALTNALLNANDASSVRSRLFVMMRFTVILRFLMG